MGKRQKTSTSGFTFGLPLCKASNLQMAQYLLENAQLEEVNDVLTCEPREAVAALKWLQLHCCTAPLTTWHAHYKQLQNAKQLEGEDDMSNDIEKVKETVYYPLLLAIFKAAALGQSEVQFRKQDYGKSAPREDIIGAVNGLDECPTEVKLVTHASQGGKDGGVRANIDAFAGLARCLSKVTGTLLLLPNSPVLFRLFFR